MHNIQEMTQITWGTHIVYNVVAPNCHAEPDIAKISILAHFHSGL